MRVGLRSMLKWAFTWSLICLLDIGRGVTATTSSTGTTPAPISPSSAATPSPGTSAPATLSPGGTPSPSTLTPGTSISPTTLAPTIAPTPSPEDSSSSSSNSRGTVVAWALFTVAVCVALLITVYNREQRQKRRIQQGESLRQNLTSSDVLQPPFGEQPSSGRHENPTMSSF